MSAFLSVSGTTSPPASETRMSTVSRPASASPTVRHMERSDEINFVDVSVSRSTDTILVRATVPNPKGSLIDGQLVQVILESGTAEEKVLVPQAALIADQAGIYVFIVEDGKAVVKRLKTGADVGADIVVEEGLKGGEQVIVQGLQGVRPGAPVQATPLPKTMNRS